MKQQARKSQLIGISYFKDTYENEVYYKIRDKLRKKAKQLMLLDGKK